MSGFKTLFKTALLNLFWALLPFIVLATILRTIDMKFTWQLLCVLIAIIIEIWILLKVIIPWFGDALRNLVSSEPEYMDEDNYIKEANDFLVQGDNSKAEEAMERLTRDNGKNINSWISRADFLENELHDVPASLKVLQEGSVAHKWNKQDQAYFLYRIGKTYAGKLNDKEKAREYWQKAVDLYPETSYGRQSSDKLSGL